jgi:2-polyprenyl-3-methyl-5-hydroxy-6-metoxy-1,4-benzoquinol methylase
VLFLFDCGSWSRIHDVIGRLPEPLDAWLDEIVVMADPDLARSAPASGRPAELGKVDLLVHRSPRPQDFGAARKAAFEYALRRDFDLVVVFRAGVHPPEAVPALLEPLLEDPDGVVVGSRLVPGAAARRESGRLRRLVHLGAAVLLDRILRLRLRDYQSTLRVLPKRVLRAIPFQLDADDGRFDIHLLVQCRALGVRLHEVPAAPGWREFPTAWAGVRALLRVLAEAVDYRMHQLHLVRRGRFLVDADVRYQLKRSPTGSHAQIVDAIRPGTRVLDLGCSQGLLARPLRAKDVLLTGVDARPPEGLAEELHEYFQRDLEQPLQLPTGRVFDYVVCSDVIEHLRERETLLRSVRRFLREDGRLIISTPNIALWFYRLSLFVGRFEYGPRGVLDRTHVHLFTRATFRREVERAGFRVLRERVTALPFEVVFESTGRSRLVAALAQLYWLLARLWPEMFAYQVILEAEITTLDEESIAR